MEPVVCILICVIDPVCGFQIVSREAVQKSYNSNCNSCHPVGMYVFLG